MSAASRGAIGIIVGATMTAVACGLWPTFPDDNLHPPRDGGAMDGSDDIATGPDGASPDAAPDAAPGDDTPEASVGMDADVDAGADESMAGDLGSDITAAGDGGDGGDGGDAAGCPAPVVPPDANACDFVPHDPVCTTQVAAGVPGGRDLAFNGAGQLAIGAGNTVVLLDHGTRTTLFTDLPGEVTVLRFTPDRHLVVSTSGTSDAGEVTGSIELGASTGGTHASRLSTTMRLGGVAVDRASNVYFANTSADAVRRITPTGSLIAMPVATVPQPTLLALDATESALYVASAVGNVYRVALADADAGMPTQIGGSFGSISGLAVDTCGNVYVADVAGDRIWRVGSAPGAAVSAVVTDVMQPRGLAFGEGGTFDPRVLYTLSGVDGSVHAASVVAMGVALPVPLP